MIGDASDSPAVTQAGEDFAEYLRSGPAFNRKTISEVFAAACFPTVNPKFGQKMQIGTRAQHPGDPFLSHPVRPARNALAGETMPGG